MNGGLYGREFKGLGYEVCFWGIKGFEGRCFKSFCCYGDCIIGIKSSFCCVGIIWLYFCDGNSGWNCRCIIGGLVNDFRGELLVILYVGNWGMLFIVDWN